MASGHGQRYQSVQKSLQVDQLVVLHDQMLQAGKIHSADQLGNLLLKMERRHFPWLTPMGDNPVMGVWLNELGKREKEEQHLAKAPHS